MEKIYYRHMMSKNGYRFTIAGQYAEDECKLVLGVSVCSKGRNYDKHDGRNRSGGRLLGRAGTPGRSYVYFTAEQYGISDGNDAKLFHQLTEQFSSMRVSAIKKHFGLMP